MIVNGHIHTRYLYTIREAERVHDNVMGALVPAASDIIKIKGKAGSWECIFFQKEDKSCEIYDQRPLECRILKCWDTREIEAVYKKNRLVRRDLLKDMGELWELIQLHEEQCSHEMINNAIQDLGGTSGKQASEKIIAAVQYDRAIRQLITEKGQVTDDMLDFLFGRPLTQALKTAGCRIEKVDHAYRVKK